MTQTELSALFSHLDGFRDEIQAGLHEVRDGLAKHSEMVAGLDKSCALATQEVKALGERVSGLECWRKEHDEELTATGKHKLADFEAQVRDLTKLRAEELADRKRARIDFGVKAALLALGSVLAIVSPLFAKLLGIG